MRTWSCAAALLLVLASSVSARQLLEESQCVLSVNWETEVDQQAFANANTACPKAAGKADSTACLPCVCASMNLFGDALTHALAKSTPRPDLATNEGMTFASQLFGTCINENFGSFANPAQVQQGLTDCLTSVDSFISGPQMMEFCGNWGKQAMLTAEEEPIRHVIRDVAEMPHKKVVSSQIHEARLMQEEPLLAELSETSLEGSTEESSSFEDFPPPPDREIFFPPPPPGVYPPVNPPGVYPPPPPPGSSASINVASIVLQMSMALLSAVLLAGVMMA